MEVEQYHSNNPPDSYVIMMHIIKPWTLCRKAFQSGTKVLTLCPFILSGGLFSDYIGMYEHEWKFQKLNRHPVNHADTTLPPSAHAETTLPFPLHATTTLTTPLPLSALLRAKASGREIPSGAAA